MNALFVFAVVIAAVAGRPSEEIVSVSQDTIGNYNLKYAIDGISRVENGDAHGNVNGAFSYIDPHGILRKTEFVAGIGGYQAIGTDVPIDTPEVAHAKAEHLAVHHARSLEPRYPEFQGPEDDGILIARSVPLLAAAPAALPIHTTLVHPAPLIAAAPLPIHAGVHVGIGETPEVLAARAEHFAAHAAARAAHAHGGLLIH